jgi:thiol-disulfide isomerase/thioredoxin
MKIIKITASWCPSCLIMNQVIDDIVFKYNLEMKSLDFDLDQNEVEKYNVDTILPVLIKTDDNNNEISRIKGEHSKKEIEAFIEG